jgi:hypothetical protein
MLNFIWAGFIVTALFAACWQAIATVTVPFSAS